MPGQKGTGHPDCSLVTLSFNPSTLLGSYAVVSLPLEVYSFSFFLTVGIRLLFFSFLLPAIWHPFCFSVCHHSASGHLVSEPRFGSQALTTIDDSRSEGTVKFLRSGQ
ncbi:hypothetical protein M9H77_02329 [Catharanthus roseus]|uniref:Uncharacterized protein n=1 Tax=Catharanthus roseus TaxID=4058 RepID=A0ACC0C8D6_CATRO|nr:hypothetical protein M9H77_02329 [Catharanthus roseus]